MVCSDSDESVRDESDELGLWRRAAGKVCF